MCIHRLHPLLHHYRFAHQQVFKHDLAISDTNFDPATTYTLLLECKGDNVVAQIAGKQPLKATGPDFHVKKPGLVILVGGTDGQEVAFDNVKVWALK